jgi:hypothetical protein
MKTFLTALWTGLVLRCGPRSETYHVRVLELVDDGDVLELDVEELVHALEGSADGDVVLELDGDLVVDEGFEEAGAC